MPSRIGQSLRTFLVVLGIFLFSYIFTIVLITGRAVIVLNQAFSTYQLLRQEGFTSQVESNYSSVLPKLETTILEFQSPLMKPLLAVSKQSRRVKLSIEAYEYLKLALPALPKILGMVEPQKYLIAFQNPAEARGTGGIFGAFAIVSINKGQVEIKQVGTNNLLQSLEEIPISMPEEFQRFYGSDPAIWQNSNLSPHFPYGAQIWLALWKSQYGEELDGVITLDPIVLRHILSMTGPVVVDGLSISQENVVAETLSASYFRFEDNNVGRKQFLIELIKGVAVKIEKSSLSITQFIDNMITPLLQHRILIFNSDSKVQETLSLSPISGTMSIQPSNEFRLVIQNTAGNKMDYYVERELSLTSRQCLPAKITRAEIKITNTVSASAYLPSYVNGRLDLDLPRGKNNSTSVTVVLYGPPGAILLSALDKQSGDAIGYVKSERLRQALVIPLDLAAGQSRSFLAEFEGGLGPIDSHEQPLVRPQRTFIKDSCHS